MSGTGTASQAIHVLATAAPDSFQGPPRGTRTYTNPDVGDALKYVRLGAALSIGLLITLCARRSFPKLLLTVFIAQFFFAYLSIAAEVGPPPRVASIEPKSVPVSVLDKSDLTFRRLSPEGLSQTRVANIVQDDTGYVWLGTSYGVDRYDGYTYKVFTQKIGDPASLSGVLIYALFKDSSGNLWVATDEDLNVFDQATGGFRHYSIDSDHPTIINIFEGGPGLLWLSTKQGLYRLEVSTGKIRKFQHADHDTEGLSSSDIKSTGRDRSGVFWVATANGLEAMNEQTGKVSNRIPLSPEVWSQFGFYEDSHGLFWIYYASGSGLALYDRKTNSVRRLDISNTSGESKVTGVMNVLESANGDMWIATYGSGLLRFNRETFTFNRYTNDPNDPQSIPGNRLTTLSEDREGNIWVGFEASPPATFSPWKTEFRKLWPTPSQPNKFGESFVNAIFEDKDGTVWLGANTALIRLNPSDGSTKRIDLLGPGSEVDVISVTQDDKGVLWLGTVHAGLISYDPKNATVKIFRHDAANPKSISNDVVTRVLIVDPETMWITTWDGLDRLNPRTGEFTVFRMENESANAFFNITADTRNNLWIGTALGLVRFSLETKSFERFLRDPTDPFSISNNTINSTLTDRSGKLWVGTQNGLNHSEASGKFSSLFEEDGLPGNAISCMLEDENGELWVSTNQGVGKLDPTGSDTQRFLTSDGLPGEDMTGWNSCYRSPRGTLYFAGYAGAVMSNADAPARGNLKPPVVFTSVEIDGQALQTGSATKHLNIPHRSSISVSFAALSYRLPAATRYRYRLHGLDEDWHASASGTRSLSFAYLPAGKYNLEVQAALMGNEWGDVGATLPIVVLPPWWTTWWFITSIAALLLLTLLLAWKFRVRKISSQYEIRLEERLSERNRVARELHDTLLQTFQGLIFRLQAVRQLIAIRPDEATTTLDKLLDRGDLALIESRQAIQSLRDPRGRYSNFLSAVRAEADDLSASQEESKRPKFTITARGTMPSLPLPVQEALFMISCEAMRNAFRHANASKIGFTYECTAKGIFLSVSDDGRGIVTGSQDKHDHFGVKGMKERARAVGITLVMETSGSGTTVIAKYSLGLWRNVLRRATLPSGRID
ncbi:DNA-binding response regulator, AraC family [Ochrobactrum soli]|uniref:DNA-binding response regulator, AraC family n=2 Tax=Ochrobactrum soli TaxID=2448455 RepID=A0A2P9HED7_9HYPH|nr:DNA-binding response regulator, AraC family [[Ochrobactrum] soli]